MADKVINGYASLVYNLCLPTCTLKYKEKLNVMRCGRRLFKVDQYKKYYHLEKQSLFDKAKNNTNFLPYGMFFNPFWKYLSRRVYK